MRFTLLTLSWTILRYGRVALLLAGIVAIPTQRVLAQPTPPGEIIYALTDTNRLIQFNSAAPGTLTASNLVTGLQAGEDLLGIDFRPTDGRLYGLGSTNRLYTIQPQTGAASVVAIQPFTTTLTGAAVGFDFNPVPDRIRVVNDDDQNLRLHPGTGQTAGVDVTLAYTDTDVNASEDPQIVAAAYTNNISGSTTTTLYVIDSALDILARQGGVDGPPSPNSGQLFTVGELGVEANTVEGIGFDITPAGKAYAAINNNFYTVNLTSGAATPVGLIGGGENVIGLALPTVPPPPLPQEAVYAVTNANRLLQFNSANPGTITASTVITGLQSGESVLGIDFRPATGQLYALGSSNRLYTVSPTTGLATIVGTQPLTTTLNGATFGFDFNPVPDRIRVVSEEEQNLRLHPTTGTVVVDATLAYTPTDVNAGANPRVVGAAYTNNFSGTATTTLYVIDAALDTLARQGGVDGPPSPNTGQLFTVGKLGVDGGDLVGFDISPAGNAYAVFTTASGNDFGLVNLSNGLVTRIGKIGTAESIVGLAVRTLPPPPSAAEVLFAVTSGNRLLRFNSATPSLLTLAQAITGLQANEKLVGIDFRPADGRLYGLGSSSRVYTLDPTSGVATMVGTQPLTTTLAGAAFGFDFNPVPDRIRLVGDAEQNLRLHPVTGNIAGIDASLVYSTTDSNTGVNPTAVGAAYTNNFSGTRTTTLYVIDSSRDTLALQGGANGTPSPNTGRLFTVGALGIDATELAGFDISPTGTGFVALTAPNSSTSDLGVINLATGQVTRLGAIGGGETIVGLAAPTVARAAAAQGVYGVTTANRLIQFNSATPGTVTQLPVITGLQNGEQIVGIDFRPATGQLYGLGNSSRIYTLNPTTAVATLVGTQPLTTTLNGAAFGFDFNPVPDRIRVVSDADQNLRLHPVNGRVAGVDGTLVYTPTDANASANPSVVGVAYTNNSSGVTSTTLYVLDADLDTLALQGGPNGAPSPNSGRLFTVGKLGVDVSNQTGFDIAPAGVALAVVAAPNGTTSSLYSVDLASGQVRALGTIGGGEVVVGLAIPAGSLQPSVVPQIYLPGIVARN